MVIPSTFNYSRLVCIPKKPAGTDPQLGEYYTADAAMPLSVVDTSNRLLALAGKIALEEWVGSWVSRAQQGFLIGRSMFENILSIDYCAKLFSLEQDYGAVVLFGFKAAFPSLSHDFRWQALQQLGVRCTGRYGQTLRS